MKQDYKEELVRGYRLVVETSNKKGIHPLVYLLLYVFSITNSTYVSILVDGVLYYLLQLFDWRCCCWMLVCMYVCTRWRNKYWHFLSVLKLLATGANEIHARTGRGERKARVVKSCIIISGVRRQCLLRFISTSYNPRRLNLMIRIREIHILR